LHRDWRDYNEYRSGKCHAPGFYTDLVVVEGDRLADIDVVINKRRRVMKGGMVVVNNTAKEYSVASPSRDANRR
jgi:hypothetical protein